MNIIELKEREHISQNRKLTKLYIQFGNLLKELEKKQLPVDITEQINQEISEINTTNKTDNELLKLVKQKQTKIVTLVEKQLKIVPKKYYSTLWWAKGMGVFGLPIGGVFALIMSNPAMLAICLPIGIGIGSIVGSGMDKKASDEGRQLDIEIN